MAAALTLLTSLTTVASAPVGAQGPARTSAVAPPRPPAAPAAVSAAAPIAAAPAATPSAAVTGLVTIESDQQLADNQTGIVTATGNVRITYPDRGMVATSRQAQYFSKEGRIVLSGDVDVVDSDGQSIKADRVTYRLDSERMVAEPPSGQQVRSRLRVQPVGPSPAKPVGPASAKPPLP
jgi:lipopolysaccharide export system protein LptA